ncbi:unnamed protein product [Cyclocybe aegerita]|uniref:Uncharacterized protein n=1 Tax=Cyclocybe aegerita TaxID=1973307 RepID=A0A8S0XV36_CYCAE|nr:unnamed protein product [Cyclocybe aegerita]
MDVPWNLPFENVLVHPQLEVLASPPFEEKAFTYIVKLPNLQEIQFDRGVLRFSVSSVQYFYHFYDNAPANPSYTRSRVKKGSGKGCCFELQTKSAQQLSFTRHRVRLTRQHQPRRPKCADAADAYKEGTPYAIVRLQIPSVALYSMYIYAGHGRLLGWKDNLGSAVIPTPLSTVS